MEKDYADGKEHGKELEYFYCGEIRQICYYLVDKKIAKLEWRIAQNEKRQFLSSIFLKKELYENCFSRIGTIIEIKKY